MSKRSLDYVLQKICQGHFLKFGSNKNFYFEYNGLKLKEKLLHCLTEGKTDLIQVKNEDEVEVVLNKGLSAIQIPENMEISAFANRGIVSNVNSNVKYWNLVKVAKNSTTMQYQGYFRARKQFWKEFMFNPGQVSVQENLNHDHANLKIKLEEFVEDIPEVTLESIQVNKVIKEEWQVFHSQFDINVGTMAVLLDSLRIRQFCKTSRLAITPKIAPISVGIVRLVEEKSEVEKSVIDMARYIELLLLQEKIDVIVGNDLQTFDNLGIPYTLIVDQTCLNNGIIRIRDRETTWHEQIHLANVVPRMVNVFQNRKVSDTLTSVKQKYNL